MRSEDEIRARIDELYKAIDNNRDPNLSETENAYNSIIQIAGLVHLKWVLQEDNQ